MKTQVLKTLCILGIFLNCLGVNNSFARSYLEGTDLSNTLSPGISKSYVSSFSHSSATIGGEITSDGGSTITERGIVWNTTGNPTDADNKVAMGSGLGSFSGSVTGLSASTKIYHRAYAINSQGTFYGSESSFTTTSGSTVITFDGAPVDPATGMLSTSQFSGGGKTFDVAYSSGGIYYMDDFGGHIGLIAAYDPGINQLIFETKDGSELTFKSIYFAMDYGVLKYTVKGFKDGLEQASQSFTITTSDPNNAGFYSQEIGLSTNFSGCDKMVLSVPLGSDLFETYINFFSFTTGGLSVPSVTTSSARFITNSSAVLGGDVTSDGGSTVTERGVVYNTTGLPSISDTKVPIGTGTGAFSKKITGLNIETKYYVRAYAINALGICYGNEIKFTTTATPTSVSSIERSTGAVEQVNTAEVSYVVTFTENVTGLSTANFTLTTAGNISGASVSSVSGTGNSFIVKVNTGSGDGTIRLDMSNATGVTPSVSNVPYTGGAFYSIDKTVPVISGVIDGGIYNTDITISFNEGTATLNGSSFISGTTISAEGHYALSVTDAAGNNSSLGFIIDKTAPVGAISILNGSTYTNSENVIISVNYTDGQGAGGVQMRFSNDNTSWSEWEAAAVEKSWNLTAGDGSKIVYVQFRDIIENSSASFFDAIFLDTVFPSGSVSINDGAAYSDSGNVTLNISAQDNESAVKMRFSNDNSSWSIWESDSTTKSWALSSGDGIKTVHMQLADEAGNISESLSDNINLDTQAPSGFTVAFNEAAVNNGNKSSISFSFTNAEIGTAYDYSISSNGGVTTLSARSTISSPTETISGLDLSGLQDGALTLSVVLTDNAGNTSTIITDTILKDVIAPADYSVAFDQPGINSENVSNASFSFTGAEVGTYYSFAINSTGGGLEVAGSGAITNANEQVTNIDVSGLKDGQLTLNVTLTDEAGNAGSTVGAVVDKDVVIPFYSISSTENNPTNSQSIQLTIQFSELVNGFALEDLNLLNATASNFQSADQQKYTLDLIPASDGNVSVSINAGVAFDKTGNGNSAGAIFSIMYDGTLPGLTISSPEPNPTNQNPFLIQFTFDETVSGFDLQDIEVVNGVAANLTTVDSKRYSAEIAPANDGSVSVEVASAAAEDAAGNLSKSAAPFSIVYDGTSPAGYAVVIEQSVINSANQNALSFQLQAAEVGTMYQYAITSSGGTGIVSGTGTVSDTFLQISNIDVSSLPDGTLNLVLTLTDAAGNVGPEASATVNKDATLPTVLVQNITKEIDANGEVNVLASEVDNGSYDNISAVSFSLNKTSFDCTNSGDNTVELTVSDEAGNTSMAAATITIVDKASPIVLVKEVTVQLDVNGAVAITPEDVNNGSTDNCSIASLSLNKTSFTCSNLGTNTVILTVTDKSGNTANASATVVVEDLIAPVALAKNVTVQLDANGQATITAEDINNGSSDNCSIAGLSLSKTNFGCDNTGVNEVTLTITDKSGNTATAVATVSVEENLPPTVVVKNITAELDANGQAVITAADVDNGTSDNCSLASLTIDKATFDCTSIGTHAVALTAIDNSGNSSSAIANVTVEDNLTPSVATRNITISLDANGQAAITTADIENGSVDNCGIKGISLDKTSFDCSEVGVNNVVLTVEDIHGNIATSVATVTVEEKIAPTVMVKNITVELDANGQAVITGADVDNGSSDNCSLASLALDKQLFNCESLGANTVTLTVTDVNGNSSFAQAIVTVTDAIAPVITQRQSFSINENSAQGTIVGTVAVQDNCFTHQWSIQAGNIQNAFIIDNNGVIRVNNVSVLDYEVFTDFTLTLLVADEGNNGLAEEVIVHLNDMNEYTPHVVSSIEDQKTDEDSQYTFTVSSSTFADTDKDDQLTLSAAGLPEWLSFESALAAFNGIPKNEDVGTYVLTLRATDKAGHFTELSFKLEVINTNDAPYDIELDNNLVEENQPSGTYIGKFNTKDVDKGDVHSFQLVEGQGDEDNSLFYLEGADLYAGQHLDYELKTSYSVRIASKDAMGASVEKVFVINVNNVEDVRAFLPNLFTPNEDKSNDRFILRTNGLSEVSFRIFDRLGKVVFETTDVTKATTEGWDGTSKGEKMPSGTYVWQLSGKFYDGQNLNVDGKNVGNIILVR